MKNCPYCKGKGVVPDSFGPRYVTSLVKKQKCLELKRKGLSYRAIAKEVGFKNAHSAWSAIQVLMKTNKIVNIKPS